MNYIYTNSTSNDISIKLYYKSIPSGEPYPEPNREFVVEAEKEYTLSYGGGLWGSIVEPLSVGESHPSNSAVISNGIRIVIQYRRRSHILMRPLPNLYRFDTYTQEYTDGIVYMRYTFKDADFVML